MCRKSEERVKAGRSRRRRRGSCARAEAEERQRVEPLRRRDEAELGERVPHQPVAADARSEQPQQRHAGEPGEPAEARVAAEQPFRRGAERPRATKASEAWRCRLRASAPTGLRRERARPSGRRRRAGVERSRGRFPSPSTIQKGRNPARRGAAAGCAAAERAIERAPRRARPGALRRSRRARAAGVHVARDSMGYRPQPSEQTHPRFDLD